MDWLLYGFAAFGLFAFVVVVGFVAYCQMLPKLEDAQAQANDWGRRY